MLLERGDLGQNREVVEGRRRGGRPFEAARIPRITSEIPVLIAIANADVELDYDRQDAHADDHRPHQRDDQIGMPIGMIIMIHPARHALEAEDIERREGEPVAHQPAPEGDLPPELIEGEAEHLGEPEAHAGEASEDHAADDDVMEVRHEEQRVVQHEVRARHREQHARHATDRERDHEAHRPQHRRMIADAAAEHREQPVEKFHAGRDRDDARHDAEEGIDVGARAHGEEVVQPHEEAEHADRRGGVDHRFVAEQRLARESGDNLRESAERWQNQDIHLRVAPDPDQVDVHHRIPTKLVGEEMHAEIAVSPQQHERGGQHREDGDDQDVGDEGRPGEHRHLHQAHARRTHTQDGDDEVDTRQRCAEARYLE